MARGLSRQLLDSMWWMGLGELKGGPKALVTLKTVYLEVRACWKARGRGTLEAGFVQMPRSGQCQPLLTTLPLAMEERARVDIIFY